MRTEAERAEWKERMGTLVKRIANMSPTEREATAARMPIVTCEGHTLSICNQMLLAFQAGRVLTMVAGFRQWIAAGRAVRKGEHSIGSIRVPMGKHKEGEEVERKDSREELHFAWVPMFDVSQTDEIAAAGSAA